MSRDQVLSYVVTIEKRPSTAYIAHMHDFPDFVDSAITENGLTSVLEQSIWNMVQQHISDGVPLPATTSIEVVKDTWLEGPPLDGDVDADFMMVTVVLIRNQLVKVQLETTQSLGVSYSGHKHGSPFARAHQYLQNTPRPKIVLQHTGKKAAAPRRRKEDMAADAAKVVGMVQAIAEAHRDWQLGDRATEAILSNAGITRELALQSGVDPSDLNVVADAMKWKHA